MTLNAGARLGHFEILGMLGMGGMGEVYHARDLELGREVAVKVLPDRVAQDAGLLQRFDREARALAALNHPHIAALYSVEREGASPFLVMELVGGRTLQKRMRAGPMPLDDVLALFAQIAEALEAAHERGIIHRDLKPANIKITEDDRVKILDFGLAKAFEAAASTTSGGGTVALEPESGLTAEGAIVGTIAYMSPEQARGKPVDKRTDIWAFGCMLYEALAGEPPFRGETGSDTMARILEREPDWNRLPEATPVRVRELLWRCLQKDPKRRLRDIGEAWFGIREHQSSATDLPMITPPPTTFTRRTPAWMWGLMLAAVLGGGAVGALIARSSSAPTEAGTVRESAGERTRSAPVRRFSVERGDSRSSPLLSPVVSQIALSPDGRYLAYLSQRGGQAGVFVRPMDQFESRYIPGTEGAYGPFFSPDGEWLGMIRPAGGMLQIVKTPSSGGALTQVTSMPGRPHSGQTWGEGDLIVVNPSINSGLAAVRAAGGALEPLTTLDEGRHEQFHIYPQVLPGGNAVLFTSVGKNEEGRTVGGVDVFQIDTRERKRVLEAAAFARYVPSGHLLYVPYSNESTPRYVAAVPFDLDRLEATRSVGTPVLDRVYIHPISYLAQFDVAADGTLAFIAAHPHDAELVWVDRTGAVETLPLPLRDYRSPRLSPDGRRIAVTVAEAGGQDVWIHNLDRGSLSRLTFSGTAHSPLWSPDGRELIVASRRDRFVNLFAVDADGSGHQRPLTQTDGFECPTSSSRDGSVVAWASLDLRQSTYRIAVGQPSLDSTPIPYFNSAFREFNPSLSPDGKWVAFVSDRTGRQEVYIAPFPGPGGITQISTGGGTEPIWSHYGAEVFYREGDRMMAVPVEPGPPPKIGVPQFLFEGRYLAADLGFANDYDVAPDGRFLMVRRGEAKGETSLRTDRINFVLNWFEELEQLVPTGSRN
jgi:serine/threonine protein kinase/Tol biopolymer transport system component